MLSKFLLITERPAFSPKAEAPYTLCETISKRMGKRNQERHTQKRKCKERRLLLETSGCRRDRSEEDWLAEHLSRAF